MKQGFKACVCAVVLCAELFAAGAFSAYAAQEQPLPDSGMTLDTAELTLDITEGDPAPVAYLNVQAPNDYFFLIWTSSDPAVASVDGTGKVTGHAEGTAAVTARNERGEKTTCTITVRKSTASRLVLNTSDLTLTITEQEPAPTKQLKLEQNKGGFTYVRQWVSSNPAVASVSTNGSVKAQGSGKAVISALTTAGQVIPHHVAPLFQGRQGVPGLEVIGQRLALENLRQVLAREGRVYAAEDIAQQDADVVLVPQPAGVYAAGKGVLSHGPFPLAVISALL